MNFYQYDHACILVWTSMHVWYKIELKGKHQVVFICMCVCVHEIIIS